MQTTETMTAEITIPAHGEEEAHTVFLCPSEIGDDGFVLPASICIDHKVDMTPAQARQGAAALSRFAEQLDPTPVSPAILGAIEGVARERGIALAELATVAGVDLESISGTDLTKLGMTLIHWEERLAAHLLRVMKSA